MQDPNRFSALVRSLMAQQVSVRDYCISETNGNHGYMAPEEVISRWISGKSKPPLTKIKAAAILLMAPEETVALCLTGFRSQEEAIADRKARRHAEQMADQKAKYHTDENFKARQKLSSITRRKARREKVLANPDALNYRQKVHYGLIPQEERSRNRAALKRKNRHKEYETYRAKLGFVILDGKKVGIKSVIQEIRILRMRADRIGRSLDAMAQRLSKPWHNAGFLTHGAWVASGSDEALEYQRLDWQVTSHRRRARKCGAGGNGVQRTEWIGIMAAWDYRCAYCGKHRSHIRDASRRMDLEMDHVVPMPYGPDDRSNIVPACKPCNSSKSDTDLLRWAAGRGLFLSDRVMAVYSQVCEATFATR